MSSHNVKYESQGKETDVTDKTQASSSTGTPVVDEVDDRRSYVGPYSKKEDFPLALGETVWIVQDGNRAPLGEFVIVRAHANDLFELRYKQTGAVYGQLVEGKYLRRDPF